MVIIFVALILLSVIIYELAYYWIAKKMGAQATEINLLTVGGIQTIESFPGIKSRK
jgi:hypothetical protein